MCRSPTRPFLLEATIMASARKGTYHHESQINESVNHKLDTKCRLDERNLHWGDNGCVNQQPNNEEIPLPPYSRLRGGRDKENQGTAFIPERTGRETERWRMKKGRGRRYERKSDTREHRVGARTKFCWSQGLESGMGLGQGGAHLWVDHHTLRVCR